MWKYLGSISDKFLAFFVSASIGLGVIVFLLPVMLISISQIVEKGENQYTQLEVYRAQNTLQKEMDGLNQLIMDWSSWDETYEFVQNPDPMYIVNNLSDSTIPNLDIDVFLVLNSANKIVLARYFPPNLEAGKELPFSVSELLQTYPALLNQTDLVSGRQGLVLIDNLPMMVAARPILSSQVKGPPMGTLLFFRFLNTDEFDKIEKLTLRKISVFPAAALPTEITGLPIPSSLQDQTTTLVRDTEFSEGYHYLFDLNNQPVLILKVENPRILFAQGKTTSILFSTMLLLMAGLLSFGVYRITLILVDTRRIGRKYLERFQALVQQSSEAILLVNSDWQILEANPASMQLLNWQHDPAHPARLTDLLTFETELDASFLLQTVQNGRVIEEHGLRHDGQALDIELSPSQISDEETHAFSISLRDISARKQAEKVVRESEELFRTIFENATAGVCVTGLNGRFLRTNDKLCEIFGYSQEEIRQLFFNDVTYREDKEIGLNFLKQMLSGQLNNANFEKRYVHKSGQIIWALVSTGVVRKPGGEALYFVTYIQDITGRKQLEERLRHDAMHDPLTGLGNRNLLLDHLSQVNERKKRKPGLLFALLFLDFDRFKMLNDTLGHYAGDQLLIEASRRLEQGLRSSDHITRYSPPEILARIAGDEFVILLEDFQSVEEIQRIAERVEKLISSPYKISGIEVNLTASIGLVIPDQPYNNPEDMIRDADIAMYRAKLAGGAKVMCFNQEMHQSAMAKMQMETDLRQAVERGEFVVYFQPLYTFQNEQIFGFEALVRWNSPRYGFLTPGEFIPLSEETGLIAPIGYYVMEEACRQMQKWRKAIPTCADLILSVNLSSRQIMNGELVENVRAILEKTGFDPKGLWLEVTESTMVQMSTSVWTQLSELRAMGICIEIDDFGTGYSSLSYLQDLPIDGLKIDRSFIRELQGGGYQIVKTLIDLSHSMGLTAVAEGVETQSQYNFLRDLACDYAQGFLMSKPVDAGVVEELLKSRAAPG
jgi:diguanylate cyclase (GGDEF)-like protein/PAS domain S-box-containing protein